MRVLYEGWDRNRQSIVLCIRTTFATWKLHSTSFTYDTLSLISSRQQLQLSLTNKSLNMLANFNILALLITFLQTNLSLAVPVEGPRETFKPRTALHTCSVL